MVISMERWKDAVAVVTGASSGIGAAITKQLLESGVRVVGLSRRVEKIEEISKTVSPTFSGNLFSVKCDISKEEEIKNAFKWINENVGPVSILINNAGVLELTNLIEGDAKLWQNMINVNVMGLCIATREAVASMKENNIDGHVIHINSTLGHGIHHYFPYISVYGATKYAVTGLTETLRKEFAAKKLKIKITSISPGYVKSEFLNNLLAFAPEYAKADLNKRPGLNPEDVTDAVLYALSTPAHVQIHELTLAVVGEY